MKVGRHFPIRHGASAENVWQPFADHRQRLARISQLPSHHHHQAKPKEQERQAAQAILNSDHFVVGRENVFSPPSELVMLVCRVVRVRFVMGVNGSRSVHFRRKLRWLISKEKPDCKARNFKSPEKTPDGLRLAVCEISRCKTNRKHERSSTSIWTAFTLQLRCAIALRCVANLSAWAAHASAAAF